MGAVVIDAIGGKCINVGGAGNKAAVAAERIKALLVGSDEKNFATHYLAPFSAKISWSFSKPAAAAPMMMRPIGSGSISVP